ncbi:MAG: TIGR04211 family SH3 domain-containing protein [Endozoicomonas sp.]
MPGIAILTLVLSSQAVAETRYITDVTYVPMRSGPGNEYRIIARGMKTGTRLELLEESAGNGFSKVRSGGQEGYIPSQYLMKTVPADQLLPSIQEKMVKVNAENTELKAMLSQKDSLLEEVTGRLSRTEEQLNQQKVDMRRLEEITAEPLAIDRRNQQLVEENLRLTNNSQVLEAENRQLLKDNRVRWYLVGGGTVLLGVLLGLLLPLIRVRKKASGWV